MHKERVKARLADLVLNEGQVEWLPSNPRQWTRTDIDKLKKSLQRDEDFQEDSGKGIYGKGYLISEAKYAEREKAEREKAAVWELSQREKEIVRKLG